MFNIRSFQIILLLGVSPTAWGLTQNCVNDIPGADPVALYCFDSTDAQSPQTIRDQSGLNHDLVIEYPNEVRWENNNSLTIRSENLIRTQGTPTELLNRCSSSNEFTIEAWISNRNLTNDVAFTGPLRIVTLSRDAQDTVAYLGHNYDGQHFYQVGVRTTGNDVSNFNNSRDGEVNEDDTFRVPEGVLKFYNETPSVQRVLFTRNSEGEARFYVSDRNGVPILHSTGNIPGNLDWTNVGAGSFLALANEINAFNDDDSEIILNTKTEDDKPYLGTYHALAIYCQSFNEEQVLGQRAPTDWLVDDEIVNIDPDLQITPAMEKAQDLYTRINSVRKPVAHPVIQEMATFIASGDLLGAARVATEGKGFINTTVRDFAKQMFNRDKLVGVDLTDGAATVMGVVRDERDAREILTGNYYYAGTPERTAARRDMVDDFLKSNNHYEDLERAKYDYADPDVFKLYSPQKLVSTASGGERAEPHRDPAGVLTSRGFMEAHAVAGTNRRLVEYSFEIFLCRPIKQWADNTLPDDRVRRDVDRFPGGDNALYQSTCSGCHAGMDPLASAFSYFTFENDFVKYTFFLNDGDPDENPLTTQYDQNFIVQKANRNADVFERGAEVTSDQWTNYITRGNNVQYFEWDSEGPMKGNGIGSFGEMLSRSGAFPKCMTKRVFTSLCKRPPEPYEEVSLDIITNQFVNNDNYNLKRLFERVAVTPECLGN